MIIYNSGFIGKIRKRRRVISWAIKKRIRERLRAETGAVVKEHGARLRVCLVYPNGYSLGMSNLGFQSAYRIINSIDECVAERAFLPDAAEAAEHKRTNTPLLSYESQRPAREFDVVAFSVSFEQDFFNIPHILALAGMEPLQADRSEGPIVIAGGAAVSINPEAVADFIDLFLIGEAEGALDALLEKLIDAGWSGADKAAALEALDAVPSVYVPSLYECEYDGVRLAARRAKRGAKEKVVASKNFDLGKYPAPSSFVYTPDTEFKGTYLTELERGCPRGCRFCAAGFIYLPPRLRSVEEARAEISEGVKRAGSVGLVGAAVSEYPAIRELLDYGVAEGGGLTLSSLRADAIDSSFAEKLKASGYRTATLAPEAGSERLRRVLNKEITDEELIEAARFFSDAGLNKIKLYFMAGLPTETDEDAAAIADLSARVKKAMGKGTLKLSITPFIPKPHTPFERCAFGAGDVLDARISLIRRLLLKERGVSVDATPASEALTQSYLSRADRRGGAFISEAARTGIRKAAAKRGEFIRSSAQREREKDETLPWDFIDFGFDRDYLWREYRRGIEGKTTPPCNVGSCLRCGVCR